MAADKKQSGEKKKGIRKGESKDELANGTKFDSQAHSVFQRGEKAHIGVQLEPPGRVPTEDQILWLVIRNSTKALSFENYSRFMNSLLCKEPEKGSPKENAFLDVSKHLKIPYTDSRAYSYLKVATEAFMIVNVGVSPMDVLAKMDSKKKINWVEEISRMGAPFDPGEIERLWKRYIGVVNGESDKSLLPYIALILDKFWDFRDFKDFMDFRDFKIIDEEDKIHPRKIACYGLLKKKIHYPNFIELIWSYWHEEGMMVQTMNAISRRFQNVSNPAHKDPLANFELDPLRPLNNLLWGYIQDEQHRLSLVRRVYEYDHHYGFRLLGKAIPQMKPADSRFRFIEAFHHLLYVCTQFFTRDDDMTVAADGFPILNHLKEVHLLLNEGQHNQYGDLPWTARQEMLMEQWLLARPEMRTFLAGRIMVDNPEPWMDRVETMKKLQGWTDTPVMHFRNLGVFGEQILLSIRFGAWSDIHDRQRAANWARYWRTEIQSYIHAYRVVTGMELSSEPLQAKLPAHHRIPSYHLQKRLDEQYKKVKA